MKKLLILILSFSFLYSFSQSQKKKEKKENYGGVPVYCEECKEEEKKAPTCKKVGANWDDIYSNKPSPQTSQQQQPQQPQQIVKKVVVVDYSSYLYYPYPYFYQDAQYYWAISQYRGPIPDFFKGGGYNRGAYYYGRCPR